MLRLVKQVVWVAMLAMLAFGSRSARAFSLEGPIGNGADGYQTPSLTYGLAGDLSAPKMIGQEFRRTTPVMYYAADSTFWEFFGTRGMDAVDQAYAVFNNITNVSRYSSNLTEFPEQAELVNFRASALALTDLKSLTMGIITEQLGLFQPTRAVWVLRSRTPGPACPLTAFYEVTKRNIDIVPSGLNNFVYTSYVNGTLYTYFIYEDCGAGGPPDADAVEFPVDPLAPAFSAVADYISFWYFGLNFAGGYYTTITRDDMAGLRYLLRTNNFNIENSGPDTVQFQTNAPTFVTTQDLNLFAARARTNNAAALIALYPGLVITATSNFFALDVVTNIFETLTNSPFDPAGTPPSHPSFSTNRTTNVITVFEHTFGNVITNQFSTRGIIGTVSLGLTNSPFSPAGSPPTVVTNTRFFPIMNGVFGDFFLLPTNACAVTIVSNILTTVIATTNLTATNLSNGGVGATNILIVFTPGTITFFTNHVLAILPVTCPVDTVANRGGVEKLTFLRRDFDSLVNQFWEPATNDYTVYALTNGTLVPQRIRRVVTVPDFLFSASDITDAALAFLRNVNFNDVNAPGGAAGPGTIEPSTQITFNNVGPLYQNAFFFAQTNFFFLTPPTEATQQPLYFWGSFDGSTNDPIVYPNGTSISELENLVLGPFIVTSSLPNGEVGISYSAQLAGTGGTAPYTFSIAPGSADVPSGLSLSADGQITGIPDGPPATYDFVIRITDAGTAFKDVPFTLTIDP